MLKITLMCAVSAAAMLTTTSAQAQTAPSAQLEEVVVTAQKRSEVQVNVPISLTAVSGSGLEKAGIPDMANLANVVPAMHVDGSGAFFQPSIRGVGSALAGAQASPNIAIYVDGIYRAQPLTTEFDFIDVESVQVLKGPQGTLFGRNSTGGAIVITTRSPTFEPTLEARASYGRFNTTRAALFASQGVTDNLAVSLSLGANHSGGYIFNTRTNRKLVSESYSARAKALYTPNDNMRFTLSAELFRTKDPYPYAVTAYQGRATSVFFGVPVATDPRRIDLGGKFGHYAQGGGVNLKAEFDLGYADLTSYTSANWFSGSEGTNQMGTAYIPNGTAPTSADFRRCSVVPGAPCSPVVLMEANWRDHGQAFSQEFNLGKSGVGPVDWVVGAFLYADNTVYSFNVNVFAPIGPGGILSGNAAGPYPAGSWVATGDNAKLHYYGAPTYSGALFADATYNLGDWHFTGGARYSISRAGSFAQQTPQFANGFGTRRVSKDNVWYNISPRAVIRYSITPTSNVYASYTAGQKGGLYNASSLYTQPNPLSPENIDAYEVGYKVTGPSWRFETAAYFYSYKGLQVSTYVGGSSFLQNAPASEIYGAEAHFQGRFAEHFTLDIGGAYTHGRYTDFPNAALQIFCFTICTVPGTGVNGVPARTGLGVVNGTTNLAGGKMQRTPTWSGNIDLGYSNELAGGTVNLHGNFSYRSATAFDFSRTLVQPGYGLLNLNASWTDPSDKWTFSAIGRNVTGKRYLIQVLPNSGGFGAVHGEPMTWALQVGYKFN